MLVPTDLPNPAPPAGQRREDAPSFSRRVKDRLIQIDQWHASLRDCDAVAISIVALGVFPIGATLCGIWLLDWFGVDVVAHLPGRF